MISMKDSEDEMKWVGPCGTIVRPEDSAKDLMVEFIFLGLSQLKSPIISLLLWSVQDMERFVRKVECLK